MGPAGSLALNFLLASAAFAAAALLLVDLAARTGGCDSPAAAGSPSPPAGPTDLDAAFRELAARGWLPPRDRALCVGADPGPAAAAVRRMGFRSVVGAPATACCGLPFEEASFDFAFSATLDRARVPARVVLEMERVLRPGRVGVVLRLRLRPGPPAPDGLMRLAAPVASLLRFSDVIGARAVNGSGMVVFKKRGFPGAAGGAWTCGDAVTRLPLLFKVITEFVRAALATAVGLSGQLAMGHVPLL